MKLSICSFKGGIKMTKKVLLLAIIPLLMVACDSNQPSSNSISSQEIKQSSALDVSSEETISSSEDVVSSREEKESSTSSSSSEEIDPVEDNEFRISFDSLMMTDEEKNNINIHYDVPDEYFSFDVASNVFHKELAIAALSFVTNAPYKDRITEAYEHYGFDNLVYSSDYEVEENKDTVLYVIGHKKINDYDLINVSVAGYAYKKPWQNNFTIGKVGNHEGFQAGANKVLPVIINYLKNYTDLEKTKFFINGYSRSAAISSLVISSLIDNNLIKEDNSFAYLFETPRAMSATNGKEYKTVFNIVNSADVVTYMPPEEYGIKRIGTDIDIYVENASEVLAAFNARLKLSAFVPIGEESDSVHFTNDVEFVNYIISYLLKPVENALKDKPIKDISTRENFCDNFQDDISYLIGFAFSLPNEVIDAIKVKFDELDLLAKMGLLNDDGIYNFLSPILDENNVTYEAEKLKDTTNQFIYFIGGKSELLLLAVAESSQNDLVRLVYFHTLEAVLPLLLNLNLDVE